MATETAITPADAGESASTRDEQTTYRIILALDRLNAAGLREFAELVEADAATDKFASSREDLMEIAMVVRRWADDREAGLWVTPSPWKT